MSEPLYNTRIREDLSLAMVRAENLGGETSGEVKGEQRGERRGER